MIKGIRQGDRIIAKVNDTGLTIQGAIHEFWETIIGGTPMTRFTLAGSRATNYEECFDSIEIVEKAKPNREPGLYVIRHRDRAFHEHLPDENLLATWTGKQWVSKSPSIWTNGEIQEAVDKGTWIEHRVYARETGFSK